MPKVDLAQLQPGMILGGDVLAPDGHVLLGEGTVLTDKHVALLRRRGIASVPVLDPGAEPSPTEARPGTADAEPLSAAARERLETLEHMFAEVRDDPLMDRLYALACERAVSETAS